MGWVPPGRGKKNLDQIDAVGIQNAREDRARVHPPRENVGQAIPFGPRLGLAYALRSDLEAHDPPGWIETRGGVKSASVVETHFHQDGRRPRHKSETAVYFGSNMGLLDEAAAMECATHITTSLSSLVGQRALATLVD